MINPQRVQQWIGIYLDHIKEITPEVHVHDEEGYKFKSVETFQKNFDLDAENLSAMLSRAITPNNLVQGSWFFPRKMLLIFAEESTNQTREALRTLFDESKPVGERIDATKDAFTSIITERNQRLGKNDHSFIGVRFLSLLLGYRYPNIYDAIKPREWRVFCKYIDSDFVVPDGSTSGAKYEAYRPYLEALRGSIVSMSEIDSLRTRLTDGLTFKDDQFRWMTQDVVYVTARQLEKSDKSDEDGAGVESEVSKPEESSDRDEGAATIDDRFSYEEDLQQYVLDNISEIGFGKLRLYVDEKGRTGSYYPTDTGEIDLLVVDESGNYIVIELKANRAENGAAGQLAAYMQWVDENIASPSGRKVQGVIFAHKGKKSLIAAAKANRFPVRVVLYSINLTMTELQ